MEFECVHDFGDLVRDKVTGFEGVVMAVCFYHDGRISYGLLPKNLEKRDTVPNWTWLDSTRLDGVMTKFCDVGRG